MVTQFSHISIIFTFFLVCHSPFVHPNDLWFHFRPSVCVFAHCFRFLIPILSLYTLYILRLIIPFQNSIIRNENHKIILNIILYQTQLEQLRMLVFSVEIDECDCVTNSDNKWWCWNNNNNLFIPILFLLFSIWTIDAKRTLILNIQKCEEFFYVSK